jgi:hypothetical protein
VSDSSQWFDHPIGDLSPAQRAVLEQSLRAEGIPATFGSAAVRTDIAYEARVSTLIDHARSQYPATAAPPAYPTAGAAYPTPGYAPAPPTTNTNAIVALVFGIGSLLLGFGCGVGFLAGPVAIILGQRARREIEQTGQQGDGMALAGVITGIVSTVLLAIGVVLLIVIVVLAAAGSN